MNRNMSHRVTFESKRTFYFTKISTSFPLATSCPESAGQSVSLRYPTRPIFRFGTRPSTDRAVRVLPRRYRDHNRGPRLWWSDIHPDIGPVSQIDHQSTAPPARGGRAIISGFRRQLEGRNSESLVYAFAGMLPPSDSVLIFMPQSPLARMRIGSVPGPPGDLKDAPRFVAGTSPFLGIFMASVPRVSRVWAYQPEVSARLSPPVMPQVRDPPAPNQPDQHAETVA